MYYKFLENAMKTRYIENIAFTYSYISPALYYTIAAASIETRSGQSTYLGQLSLLSPNHVVAL